jgi:hypothetical protein
MQPVPEHLLRALVVQGLLQVVVALLQAELLRGQEALR